MKVESAQIVIQTAQRPQAQSQLFNGAIFIEKAQLGPECRPKPSPDPCLSSEISELTPLRVINQVVDGFQWV